MAHAIGRPAFGIDRFARGWLEAEFLIIPPADVLDLGLARGDVMIARLTPRPDRANRPALHRDAPVEAEATKVPAAVCRVQSVDRVGEVDDIADPDIVDPSQSRHFAVQHLAVPIGFVAREFDLRAIPAVQRLSVPGQANMVKDNPLIGWIETDLEAGEGFDA